MNDPGSTRQVALPQQLYQASSSSPSSASYGPQHTASPHASQSSSALPNPTFQPASQAQIIRAHQRDTAQIYRLTELASEIVRSLAGTRWLAHKQTVIDVAVRAAYLMLTLGRGRQTLGEEYTDVMPFRAGAGNRGREKGMPGRTRRLLTILFLLFPTLLTSPSFLSALRSTDPAHPAHSMQEHTSATPSIRKRVSTRLSRIWYLSTIVHWRHRLADLIESPLGQSMPELHMVVFLYGGRFFEWGRRLTGMGYISTQAPNPHRRASSFEPVALLLGIPLLYRLFPRHYLPHWVEDDAAQSASASTSASFPSKPISKALDPSLDPDIDIDTTTATPATAHNPPVSLRATETLLLTAAHGCSGEGQGYDTPNTYLTPEAVDLPERQCTLCLEPRGTGEGSGGTVGVTECGHIFCWGCLGGLEKLECPLCRQSLRMERLIAAYNL